jgi:hypothetical protein
MTTSLSVTDVRADIEMSAEDRRLKRLWSALPRDRVVPEEEAFALVLDAAGHYENDTAWASLQLQVLASMGAVHGWPGGAVRRAEKFPAIEDLVPGSQRFIDMQNAEREEARLREIENENRLAAENFAQSPLGRQQRETRELIAEEVDRVLRDRLAEVADEVIEERLGEVLRRFEPESMKVARERLSAATGGGQEE